ncbi:hypothetical protein Sviol_43670 [Streptomyces violascens]|uniref:Uncharacterized protein n=1 Tax=Streptomyces violascens TaxID=67381 RepID=A0ABQ3QRR4_9ACTN|nr:hypothetical protein Sviol_43670 [Streptomyces violascens]
MQEEVRPALMGEHVEHGAQVLSLAGMCGSALRGLSRHGCFLHGPSYAVKAGGSEAGCSDAAGTMCATVYQGRISDHLNNDRRTKLALWLMLSIGGCKHGTLAEG